MIFQFIVSHSPRIIKKCLEKKPNDTFPLTKLPDELILLIISQLSISDKLNISRSCKKIKTLSNNLLQNDLKNLIEVRKTILSWIDRLSRFSNGRITSTIVETKTKIESLKSTLNIIRSQNGSLIYYMYPDKIMSKRYELAQKQLQDNKISISENLCIKIIFNQCHHHNLVTFEEVQSQSQEIITQLSVVFNFVAESSWTPCKTSLLGKNFEKIVWTQSISTFLQSNSIPQLLEEPKKLQMLPKTTKILRQARFKTLKIKT